MASILFLAKHPKPVNLIIAVLPALLRPEVIIGLIPLSIILFYLISENNFKRYRYIVGYIILSTLIFSANQLLASDEYRQWNVWKRTLSIYIDYEMTPSTLSKAEKLGLKAWWTYDDDIINFQSLKNKSNILEALKYKAQHGFKESIIFNNIYFQIGTFLIIVLGFCISYWKKSIFPIFLTISAILYLIVLSSVRSSPRVNTPIIFFIIMAHIMSYDKMRKHYISKSYLYLLVPLYVVVVFSYTLMKSNLTKKKEIDCSVQWRSIKNFKAKNYSMKLFPSIGFPLGNDNKDCISMNNNRIFQENNTPGLNLVGPFTWFSRHPVFNEIYEISTKYKSRKYKNFYEFMTNENTVFFGRNIQSKIADDMLQIYNMKHTPYKHKIKTIFQDKNMRYIQIEKYLD